MEQKSLTLAMPLTEEERGELTRCEQVIEQGLPTVFEVGRAFKTIIDRKLYRDTHRTAEDYFREKWQLSRPRAYQLIDGATVRDTIEQEMSTTGRQNMPLPTNERQTRALKKAPAEKQPELWQKAVESNNGNAPTARQIVHVYETEFEEKPAKVKCDLCGKLFPQNQIANHNNQHLHTDCYYQVINAEEEAERLRAGEQKVQKECDVQECAVAAKRVDADDEAAERREAEKQELAFEARLERCRECVGKYYLVDIDGGHGIAHVYELNHHLAKVRGNTYPYPPKSQKWGAMIANFELEDLREEVAESDFAHAREGHLIQRSCSNCGKLYYALYNGQWYCKMCYYDLLDAQSTQAIEPEPEQEITPDPEPMNATAQQILDTLEQNQSWVNPIVKRFADSKYFPYETTDMKLFREVTIRKPTGETNRFGNECLKRYRLDGVAVIKINDHRYKPILVGFEVKVDKHDLLNDKKMHEYLEYVDMFFVVIPRTLGVASIDFRRNNPHVEQMGDMIVEGGSVEIHGMPEMLHPGDRERQEMTTELLMKSLWKEEKQAHSQKVAGEERLQRWCSFCLDDLPPEKLYSGVNPTTKLCRKCAQKALIDLLDPKDPEVINECQNQWQAAGEEPDDIDQHIKGIDRDKILRAGLRQIRTSIFQQVNGTQHISLKEYTPATNTTGRDESLIIGSWKTLETFKTKKALKDRIKELEQDERIIIRGRI